jgi:hypothetical protein
MILVSLVRFQYRYHLAAYYELVGMATAPDDSWEMITGLLDDDQRFEIRSFILGW